MDLSLGARAAVWEIAILETLVRKLRLFGSLPEADQSLIGKLANHQRTIASNEDLECEGDVPSGPLILASGFAYRYRTLDNGRRQITGFLLPGDAAHLHPLEPYATDSSITTLTEVRFVRLPRAAVLTLYQRPPIARALSKAGLIEKALLYEWLTSLGQRSAEQRLAHLFCELHQRLSVIGLAIHDEIDIPITQSQLGEAVGLSTVHVNRSMQSLRARGLITSKGRRLFISDVGMLHTVSGYRSSYLGVASGAEAPKSGVAGAMLARADRSLSQ